ncbi:hypothetical protein T492DRAFT_1152304 [Pavlovales sp. CCMP2436]|nr:hypothetical protein T492DRAFT_1152304 [Pavlovales sp. CCMP2436]
MALHFENRTLRDGSGSLRGPSLQQDGKRESLQDGARESASPTTVSEEGPRSAVHTNWQPSPGPRRASARSAMGEQEWREGLKQGLARWTDVEGMMQLIIQGRHIGAVRHVEMREMLRMYSADHGDSKGLLNTPASAEFGGSYLLHVACQFADTEAVELLLAHGARAHMRNSDGVTPLAEAADELRRVNGDKDLDKDLAARLRRCMELLISIPGFSGAEENAPKGPHAIVLLVVPDRGTAPSSWCMRACVGGGGGM